MVGLGGLEKLKDAGCHPGSDEVDAFVLAADKVTDDKAKAARVHVGNLGEVEDIDRWRVEGRIGLEDIA
jgi:hypothetical protein